MSKKLSEKQRRESEKNLSMYMKYNEEKFNLPHKKTLEIKLKQDKLFYEEVYISVTIKDEGQWELEVHTDPKSDFTDRFYSIYRSDYCKFNCDTQGTLTITAENRDDSNIKLIIL